MVLLRLGYVLLTAKALGFVLVTEVRGPRKQIEQRAKNRRALAQESREEPISAEPCNVVLTTTAADFDSLAAACALAQLWSALPGYCEVPTHVVLPRGAMPSVARFLAYHKHILPVRGFKTIEKSDIRALGVVDASSSERLGRAREWLAAADSVHVFDHHITSDAAPRNSDSFIGDVKEWVVEAVGSTTTMIVERLRENNLAPAPALATLYILGIRADTGGLAYESTSLRDAEALCWLLRHNASQAAVAEFSLDRVGSEVREALAMALPKLEITTCRGVSVATVAVQTRRFVSGLAHIADELLALASADVLILAAVVSDDADTRTSKKSAANSKKSWIDLIGRARARSASVDLRKVMTHFGAGGGHPRAAAVSVSDSFLVDSPEDILVQARQLVEDQIPAEVTAADLMRSPLTIYDTATVAEARQYLDTNSKPSVFVTDGNNRLRGQLKLSDVVKAERRLRAGDGVKAFMRSQINHAVPPDAKLADLEAKLESTGRLPVVDSEGILLGVVTRTDVLNARHFYRSLPPDQQLIFEQYATAADKDMAIPRREDKDVDYDDDFFDVTTVGLSKKENSK